MDQPDMKLGEPWRRTQSVIARGPEIVIVEYDSRWPELFELERARIMEATAGLFRELEHVGSSAVPGLAGKPVVDMLAAVRALEAVDAHLGALAALGYARIPFLPGRMFFLKRGTVESYNLHVRTADQFRDDDQLLLREYLRSHPEEAAAYQRLKCEIVGRIGSYQEYSPAKSEFIGALLAQARRERS